MARYLKCAVARVHRAIGSLHNKIAGPFDAEVQFVPGLFQRTLVLIDRGPAQYSKTIHRLAERRLGCTAGICQHRAEDVPLGAETDSTCVRKIIGDRIESLSASHQSCARGIESAVHENPFGMR